MTSPKKINRENLKRICWLNGYSVSALARKIGRSRESVYSAARDPGRRPRIAAEMDAILRIR